MTPEQIKALVQAPLWIIAAVLLLYLGRNWFEAALKSRFAVAESRIKTSLDIKQGLRGHEQDELVEFRVAVEKWEYFLQTGISTLTIGIEAKDFDATAFYQSDHNLFGDVRLAAVKASIFLRDPDLEVELLKTINGVRKLYYPLLETAMRDLLDLQERMLPYLNRMRLFEASGLKDFSIALNADEGQQLIALRHQMTDALQKFATDLIANYPPIAEQLYDLKAKINVHIYRPLTSTEIDT